MNRSFLCAANSTAFVFEEYFQLRRQCERDARLASDDDVRAALQRHDGRFKTLRPRPPAPHPGLRTLRAPPPAPHPTH